MSTTEELERSLMARLEALDIEIERLKTISQLNYFFTVADVAAQGESS